MGFSLVVKMSNRLKILNLVVCSTTLSLFNATTVAAYDVLHSLTPILSLFQRNEVAAMDRFNGNYYQINGNVYSIKSRDRLVIVRSGKGYLNCYYSPRDHANVVDLRIGGQVSVKGPLRITKNYRNLSFSINKCRVVGDHNSDNKRQPALSQKQKELLRFDKILDSDW